MFEVRDKGLAIHEQGFVCCVASPYSYPTGVTALDRYAVKKPTAAMIQRFIVDIVTVLAQYGFCVVAVTR